MPGPSSSAFQLHTVVAVGPHYDRLSQEAGEESTLDIVSRDSRPSDDIDHPWTLHLSR